MIAAAHPHSVGRGLDPAVRFFLCPQRSGLRERSPGGLQAAPTSNGKSGGLSGTPRLPERSCGGVQTPPYKPAEDPNTPQNHDHKAVRGSTRQFPFDRRGGLQAAPTSNGKSGVLSGTPPLPDRSRGGVKTPPYKPTEDPNTPQNHGHKAVLGNTRQWVFPLPATFRTTGTFPGRPAGRPYVQW